MGKVVVIESTSAGGPGRGPPAQGSDPDPRPLISGAPKKERRPIVHLQTDIHKILRLTAIFVLLATILAGCGTDTPAPPAAATATAPAAAAATDTTAPAAATDTAPVAAATDTTTTSEVTATMGT